jgi:hypothetical protein
MLIKSCAGVGQSIWQALLLIQTETVLCECYRISEGLLWCPLGQYDLLP